MIGRSNAMPGNATPPTPPGPSPTDAVLRVNAPADSTVIITKGGTSLSADMVAVATGGTYTHYFYIPQTMFDSNAWSITATRTNGDADEYAVDSVSQTASTIVINAVQEYNTTIIYRLNIHNYANRYYDWSSYRTSTSYGSGGVSYGSNYVRTYAQWANVAASVGTFGWAQKEIDLGLYKTCRVVAAANSTGDRIGFMTANKSWITVKSISSTASTTYNFDLSAVTGNGYYAAYATSGSSTTYYIDTYQCILLS